jgi:hypothetical protein
MGAVRVAFTVQGGDCVGLVDISEVLGQLRSGWLGTIVAHCRWLMEEVACSMVSSLKGIASWRLPT